MHVMVWVVEIWKIFVIWGVFRLTYSPVKYTNDNVSTCVPNDIEEHKIDRNRIGSEVKETP